MKRFLVLISLLLFSCVTYSQETIYVDNPNSPRLMAYQDSLSKYLTFKTKKAQLTAKYKYVYPVKNFYREIKQYKFGNEEEYSCICGSNNDDQFVFLNNHANYKPSQVVKLIPQTTKVVVNQPIINPTTYIRTTKIVHDTIKVIVHDTTMLANVPCQDTVRKVWFTTTDKTVTLIPDKEGKSMIPFIERRYYDYENKLIGSVKLDPITKELIN